MFNVRLAGGLVSEGFSFLLFQVETSTGSYFPRTVDSTGNKKSQTVSSEAKYDAQSRQEPKIGCENWRTSIYPVNKFGKDGPVRPFDM